LIISTAPGTRESLIFSALGWGLNLPTLVGYYAIKLSKEQFVNTIPAFTHKVIINLAETSNGHTGSSLEFRLPNP
jgi:hypothetical protein